jgi:hypothetical protein
LVLKPPLILKIVPKAGHEYMPEKVDYEKEGNPEKNLIRISDHSLELVSAFKEASKNFTFIFL